MQAKTHTGIKVEEVLEVIDSGFKSRVNIFTADMFDGTARVQRDFHDCSGKLKTLCKITSIITNHWGIQGFLSFPMRDAD